MRKKTEDLELDERCIQFDTFELEILLHYFRLPLESLKRRLPRAKSLTSKRLIETAIEFKTRKKERSKC